jgi:hypothetical protein
MFMKIRGGGEGEGEDNTRNSVSPMNDYTHEALFVHIMFPFFSTTSR